MTTSLVRYVSPRFSRKQHTRQQDRRDEPTNPISVARNSGAEANACCKSSLPDPFLCHELPNIFQTNYLLCMSLHLATMRSGEIGIGHTILTSGMSIYCPKFAFSYLTTELTASTPFLGFACFNSFVKPQKQVNMCFWLWI
jgi:hypothetical protein